jgi:hypothetical protein
MGDPPPYSVVKKSLDLNTISSASPAELENQYDVFLYPLQKLNDKIFACGLIYGVYACGIYTSNDGSTFSLARTFTISPASWLDTKISGANDGNSTIVFALQFFDGVSITYYLTKSIDSGTTFSDPIDLKTLIGESGDIESLAIFYDGTNFVLQYDNVTVKKWTKSVDLITWIFFTPEIPPDTLVFSDITKIAGEVPTPIPPVADFTWAVDNSNPLQINSIWRRCYIRV